MKHKTQLYLNEPGRRGEGEGGAGDGGDPFLAGPLGESKNGAALNITALVFLSGEHSRMPSPSWSRIVICAGSVRFQRCSKSPAAGRRGMTAGLWVPGNPRRQAVTTRRRSLGLFNSASVTPASFATAAIWSGVRAAPGEQRSGRLAEGAKAGRCHESWGTHDW